MVNLDKKLKSAVKIGNITFKNPLFLASGTAGFGEELFDIIDLKKFGGIILKGTTLKPKAGNPPPRVVETPSGMLNAIGLQNPGIEAVIKETLPFLKKNKITAILNIAAKEDAEFETLAKRIAQEPDISAVEINMSCPNVERLMDNGTNPTWVEAITKKVKKQLKIPVIAKLTPNITDITTIATAAENGGADAVSLINTLKGLAIDLKTQKPILTNTFGGLSGPAIKPVALRMVYEVKNKIKIPIIGIGGIMSKNDIYEFFCAGADAVQIGTLSFVDLKTLQTLVD